MLGSSVINMQTRWPNLSTTQWGSSVPRVKSLHKSLVQWGLVGRTLQNEVSAQRQLWFWWLSLPVGPSVFSGIKWVQTVSRGGRWREMLHGKGSSTPPDVCGWKQYYRSLGSMKGWDPINAFNLCCLFSPCRPAAYSWVIQTSPS